MLHFLLPSHDRILWTWKLSSVYVIQRFSLSHLVVLGAQKKTDNLLIFIVPILCCFLHKRKLLLNCSMYTLYGGVNRQENWIFFVRKIAIMCVRERKVYSKKSERERWFVFKNSLSLLLLLHENDIKTSRCTMEQAKKRGTSREIELKI